MSNPDPVPNHVDRDSRALQDWWTSDRSTPLEIAKEGVTCVCEGLFPGAWRQPAAVARCVAMALSYRMPLSGLKIAFARLAGARIGRHVYVSPRVTLDPLYPQLIELSDQVLLGLGCRLLTHEYTATRFRLGRICIGKGAVIGAFSSIRSGVSIGAGVTVGMHSLVNRDVPEGVTVAGVPARPLPGPERAE